MSKQVEVARVYLMEGQANLEQMLEILHDEEHVLGVTVIRGIEGYGESGEIHTSSILSLSLELPLIVEFFDETERVERVIHRLQDKFDLKHIVSWPATSHMHKQ